MHETSRVIPPNPEMINVPSTCLPLVTLDNLPCRETVSGPELSAFGSEGQHPLVRRLVKPSFEKLEC